MKFPDRIREVAIEKLSLIREICLTLPGTVEKPSHGEPKFFVDRRVYVMFANSHHGDGLVAVWVPVPEGQQGLVLLSNPQKYFFPPYVGKQGWIGIDLTEVDGGELKYHVETAWMLKRKKPGIAQSHRSRS